MKTIEEELKEISALHSPWTEIFSNRERFSPRAVRVFGAITCTASEFKEHLKNVDNEDLELLMSAAVGSKVKTKLLGIAIRHRNAGTR